MLADELGFLETLSFFIGFSGPIFWALQSIVGSPYGRHTSASFGPALPGKLAWFVQELPSLLVPLYVVTCTPAQHLSFWPNRILLTIFIIHYFQSSPGVDPQLWPKNESNASRLVACLPVFTLVFGKLIGPYWKPL